MYEGNTSVTAPAVHSYNLLRTFIQTKRRGCTPSPARSHEPEISQKYLNIAPGQIERFSSHPATTENELLSWSHTKSMTIYKRSCKEHASKHLKNTVCLTTYRGACPPHGHQVKTGSPLCLGPTERSRRWIWSRVGVSQSV